MNKANNKKGQIWVETVLYTLMGLVLIGVILAFAMPTIEKQKDKLTIERTIESMNNIENSIENVKINGPSSTKQNVLTISRGSLIIDAENDQLRFEIDDSSYQYSQISGDNKFGDQVNIPGTIQVIRTDKNGKKFKFVSLLDYNEKLDLLYNGGTNSRTLSKAQAPYVIIVENQGPDATTGLTKINIFLSS